MAVTDVSSKYRNSTGTVLSRDLMRRHDGEYEDVHVRLEDDDADDKVICVSIENLRVVEQDNAEFDD